MTSPAELATDVAKATALLEIGRAAEARDLLVKVVATKPDHVGALCLLAQAHGQLGSFRSMADTADRAIAAGPHQEWPYRLRSAAYRRMGRKTEAIASARDAVTRAPNLWATHVTLVEALLLSQYGPNLKEAYEAATAAVALAPSRSAVYVTMGRVLLAVGEQKRARQYFTHAVGLDPEDSSAHTMLAITELTDGRIANAGRRFGDVVAANPTDSANRTNATVAASLWIRRFIDLTWLLCLLEIAVPVLWNDDAALYVGLGLVVAGLVAGPITFVRLHRPMRRLVLARLRERGVWPQLVVPLVVLAMFTVGLVDLALDPNSSTPTIGFAVLWLAVGLFQRFQGRLRQAFTPWRRRRRYRREVFGTRRPVIPAPRRAEG